MWEFFSKIKIFFFQEQGLGKKSLAKIVILKGIFCKIASTLTKNLSISCLEIMTIHNLLQIYHLADLCFVSLVTKELTNFEKAWW